jgi:hypothetical protein
MTAPRGRALELTNVFTLDLWICQRCLIGAPAS